MHLQKEKKKGDMMRRGTFRLISCTPGRIKARHGGKEREDAGKGN